MLRSPGCKVGAAPSPSPPSAFRFHTTQPCLVENLAFRLQILLFLLNLSPEPVHCFSFCLIPSLFLSNLILCFGNTFSQHYTIHGRHALFMQLSFHHFLHLITHALDNKAQLPFAPSFHLFHNISHPAIVLLTKLTHNTHTEPDQNRDTQQPFFLYRTKGSSQV